MLPRVQSLFASAKQANTEVINELVASGHFRLEHITSHGEASPKDFWYDQDQEEWVALIAGTATLEFETGRIALRPGDYLTIPRRLKHRVTQTSQDAVWIALHFSAKQGCSKH